MGIYNNSKKEIVQKISDALDDIEGDFTQETLLNALEQCKKYPYVVDKELSDRAWRRYLYI